MLLTVLEHMPGYLLHRTRDGTILNLSQLSAAFLGVDRAAAIGLNVYDLMDADSAAASCADAAAFLDGDVDEDQVLQPRVSHETGRTAMLQIRRARLPGGPDGENTILATGLDVSADHARQQELERLYAAQEALLENMPGYLLHRTRDGTILNLSRQSAAFPDIDRADAVGRNVHDLFIAEDGEESRKGASAFLDSDLDRDDGVYPLTSRKTGRTALLQLSRRRVPGGPDGEDTIIATGLDISADRARQQALARLTAELEALMTHMPGLMMHHRRDGTILRVSAETAANLGVARDEAPGRNVFDLLAPEDVEEARRTLDALMASDQPSQTVTEQRTLRRTGRTVTRQITRARIPAGPDVEETLLTVGQDLTALATREALQRQVRALQQVMHQAPFFLLHRDYDGRILSVSEAYCHLMGKDPAAMPGGALADFFAPGEAGAMIDGDTGADHARMTITVADGTRRTLDIRRSVLPPDAPGGRPTVCSVAADVTDVLAGRARMAMDAAAVRMALAEADISVMQLARDGTVVHANRFCAALFGLTADALTGRPLAEVYDPASASAVIDRLDAFPGEDLPTMNFVGDVGLPDGSALRALRIWQRVRGRERRRGDVLCLCAGSGRTGCMRSTLRRLFP